MYIQTILLGWYYTGICFPVSVFGLLNTQLFRKIYSTRLGYIENKINPTFYVKAKSQKKAWNRFNKIKHQIIDMLSQKICYIY